MSSGARDHYVPRFYLSRWAGSDGKLARCQKIEQTREIHWKRVSPKEVAFERGLYGDLEEEFFKPLDNNSSQLLQLFDSEREERTKKLDLGHPKHRLWAKYLLAQLIRTPSNLNRLIDQYSIKGIDRKTAIEQLPVVIENERAIKDLRSLEWIITGSNTDRELVTCDYPLIFRPDDLSNPRCVIILPLGPHSYFLATKRANILSMEKDPRKMVGYINQETLKNARGRGRIFAANSYSLRDGFIEKYFV